MGWFAKIFSPVKPVDVNNVFDRVADGIDAAIYTNQEKVADTKELIGIQLEFARLRANESTEQSMARRELAKMTFKSYFAMLFMAIAVYRFDPEMAKFIIQIAGMITTLVTAIGVCYFGPHQVSKIWKSKEGK